ncbi:MAG: DNA replication/repair protein RecF [Actinomycetota bacterium]|nr:DNA replication/repair protein RecF [Actinomycetota bacterium]
MTLAPGFTLVTGPNGGGKTNLLEAIGYAVTLSSFRGATGDAMVRVGAATAIVRAEGYQGERRILVETELPRNGRPRVTVNRQPLRRVRDLLETGRVSVFSPDDLALIKGAPAGRRRYLDDGLVALHPRHETLRRNFERVVRQRNRLLTQAAGRLSGTVAATLDVWDAQMADTGEALAAARVTAVERIRPLVADAYRQLSGGEAPATLAYAPSWREAGLAAALAATRTDDLRRATSLVGPHRDDLELAIAGMPARTHASQGEQRSLALALRLGLHHAVAEEAGESPILLLDDVFSELDARRSRALLDHLPPGQVLLTTAGGPPAGTSPQHVVEIDHGRLVEGLVA